MSALSTQKTREDVNEKCELRESEASPDTECGFGHFHPKWLQILTGKKSFVLVYALTGMIQAALASYCVGTLTTMEKSFRLSSQNSGVINAAWDIGGLSSNIIFTYLASKGHRTRWVAAGMLITGLSCIATVIPYHLYGPGDDIKKYTVEYGYSLNSSSSLNWTTGNVSMLESSCNEEVNASNNVSYYIIVGLRFIIGLGTAIYWTCGSSYLDDNVRKDVVPVLLAIIQCIRMFGPTIGFLLSSYCLSMYVDISLTPTISKEDPKWIGAWWIGWYPIGVACLLCSILMAMFPKILPRASVRRNGLPPQSKKISIADFKSTVKRLMKNKIVMFNSFSSVFFIIGYMGYWHFMPKYMETVFSISASETNLISGTVGIVSNAFGVLTAGIIISKWRPSARKLAAWNVFVQVIDAFGHASFVFLSCSDHTLHGHKNFDDTWNLTEDCNWNYNCSTKIPYTPVCDLASNTVYYTPCHAGCSLIPTYHNSTKMYNTCNCLSGGSVIDGLCPVDCTNTLYIFVGLIAILSFATASGKSGNMLIQFRSVDEEDKSLSIGLTETLLSLLAFIPAPTLYGSVVDFTCLVWSQSCGESGNCWIYDSGILRYVFNLVASSFILFGSLLDTFVWYYSKNLNLYDEIHNGLEDDKNIKIKKKNRDIFKGPRYARELQTDVPLISIQDEKYDDNPTIQ